MRYAPRIRVLSSIENVLGYTVCVRRAMVVVTISHGDQLDSCMVEHGKSRAKKMAVASSHREVSLAHADDDDAKGQVRRPHQQVDRLRFVFGKVMGNKNTACTAMQSETQMLRQRRVTIRDTHNNIQT